MTNERLTQPPSSTVLKPWHWFVLAAAVPLVHCASRLSLDLWHDEIYTVDHFVSRGPLFIVSDYSAPNNHVLYSLILWPFYLVSDVNFVLRLPSFLFTIGTLAFTFAVAFRHGGMLCAVLSTSLLGLNQMFLIHTIQVRGYGLSMFFTAWLTWLALENDRTWRRWLAVAIAGAAFLYVLPTNLLFFVPLAIASVLVRITRHAELDAATCVSNGLAGAKLAAQGPAVSNRSYRPAMPRWLRRIAADASAWFIAALAAVACYLPIAAQVRVIATASSPSSWSSLPLIVSSFLSPATHDYLWFAPLIVASLAILLWPVREGTRRRWTLPIVGLGVVVGAFLLTAILRISPFERNYCPLLVSLALLSGWLLTELVELLHARLLPWLTSDAWAAISLLLVGIVLCPQLWTYPGRLKQRREQAGPANPWIADGYYCYYAADYRPSAVVRYLSQRDFERSPFSVAYLKADFLNVWWYFYHSRLSGVDTPYGDVEVYAIVPEPPPWKALADENHLHEATINTFRLIGDFGFYRLYRTAGPVDVGGPPEGAR